jgi:hypothetical protein
MPLVEWVLAHAEQIALLCGAFYVCVSCVVALTPTQRDDEALRGLTAYIRPLMEYASFLRPRDVPGVFSLPGQREWRDDA